MAEKLGYWDVHRCAWVDAEPTHVVPPRVPPAAGAVDSPAETAVPEQRGAVEAAVTADAPD